MLLEPDGSPLFEATVYSLVELRARNRAANTIESCLRSLMLFYMFLDLRGIDLAERVKHGKLLSLSEVEDLARLTRLPLESVTRMRNENSAKPSGVASFEKHRMRLAVKGEGQEVLPLTAANRKGDHSRHRNALVFNWFHSRIAAVLGMAGFGV
jgi:hypothetical protein